MRTDYEAELKELNDKISALESKGQTAQSVSHGSQSNQQLDADSTAQVLIKFQDELAIKDKQLSELQASAKKKQFELET